MSSTPFSDNNNTSVENQENFNGVKSIIESLLFVSSKPLTVKELSNFLEAEPELISAALSQLVEDRKDSGLVVLESNGHYQLATSAKNSTPVKSFLNAELREKLTDATVEVLAIIAYRQPISKAEIEAIRGVNSQYSIRNLLMRGLIEKIQNPNDARSFLYQTTTEFLMHMGLNSVKDLPDFETLVGQIKLPEVPQAKAEATAEAQQGETPAPVIEEKPVDPVTEEPITEVVIITQEQVPAQEPEPPLTQVDDKTTDAAEENNEEEFEEEDEFEDDNDEDDEEV